MSDHVLVQAILHANFDFEKALNSVLEQQSGGIRAIRYWLFDCNL